MTIKKQQQQTNKQKATSNFLLNQKYQDFIFSTIKMDIIKYYTIAFK